MMAAMNVCLLRAQSTRTCSMLKANGMWFSVGISARGDAALYLLALKLIETKDTSANKFTVRWLAKQKHAQRALRDWPQKEKIEKHVHNVTRKKNGNNSERVTMDVYCAWFWLEQLMMASIWNIISGDMQKRDSRDDKLMEFIAFCFNTFRVMRCYVVHVKFLC